MLLVFAGGKQAGIYSYRASERVYSFTYTQNNPISIVMPPTESVYISRYEMLPIFDQFMPEGWLYEVMVNHLRKRLGSITDYDVFKSLAPNIEGFLTFKLKGRRSAKSSLALREVAIGDLVENDTMDMFYELVNAFLLKSSISGVQPKVLVPVGEKALVEGEDYIVKTFGEQFPDLARNEYLCLKACERAGLPIPEITLSRHGRFIIVKKFTGPLGFEEFCTLLGRTSEGKYDGSYEGIAKALGKVSSSPEEDLELLYKMVVMSFLLKNGDAHLKNFGVLYSSPTAGDTRLAPTYDVVCTVVYIPSDTPALTLFGRKVWHSRDKLMQFGEKACLLSRRRARELFQECEEGVCWLKDSLSLSLREDPDDALAANMLRVLEFSLLENLKRTYKELPRGLELHWP